MDEIETEWLKMRLIGLRANHPAGDGTVGEGYKLAIEELLAYREGFDPAERKPDLGQWTVIELVDVRDNEPPFVVARWVNAPQEAIDGWVCDREPDAQLWFVDLGGLFNWWAASDVRRWYPIPGGER